MVLSALSSTYQLYKQDTDSLAAWLASTAKSLGFSSDPSSATSSATCRGKTGGGGRLKGKARTQAKKTATPSTAPKYIINIKDFVPLAEYVAAKATPVPDTVRTTIDRVIAVRTGFGTKLENHGNVLSELSDAKHQHFIGVLERVREVLTPFMPAPVANKSASTDDKLSNRFAGLAVYEPSQEFLDAPVPDRPAKTEGDNDVYEAETETTFEHAIFVLSHVIDDMNRVRAHIQWIWSNYKINAFDLAAAAIATNTAIDLVRNMIDDILPLLSSHRLGDMLLMFFTLKCLVKGWTIESIFVDSQDGLNYDTYDTGDGTYLTTYRLLKAFANDLQRVQIPFYKEEIFGCYDPASDRSKKTGWEKFKDDRALLLSFFTQQMTALIFNHGWPVKDEFLRGMEELSKTKEVPFYVVFAAQVFLDITYELGEAIQRPFSTMVSHTTFIDNDIKLHFEFHAKLKIKTWPATNDLLIRAVQETIKLMDKDPLRAVQAKMHQRNLREVPDGESHRLFRMSPVVSGLFLYYFRTKHRDIGLAVADVWGSIQYCQHLYNALQQEKMLDSTWRDMDVLFTNLGGDSFYVGGEVPKTPQEYFNKAGPRGLKRRSPVLSMFKARYVKDSGQVDLTPEYVSQIIERSLFEQEDTDDGSFAITQIEDPKKLQEKKKLQHPSNEGRGNAAKSGNMPVEKLIKSLVYALHAETLEYTFPYLTMHRVCWRLLRNVKESCDEVLRQLYTPTYLEKECQLPWLLARIFIAATGSEDEAPDRRPLQLAADVMNGMLDCEKGAVICTDVLGKQLGMPVAFKYELDDDEAEVD
ncbi:hypothetical protein CIB48_g7438 [Xylaria polymorpha]|nr:hypothetical protein CIB48_g7438 [Xylaria polymorpha]